MNIIEERFTVRPPRFEDWAAFNVLQTDPVYSRFLPPTEFRPEEVRFNQFKLICRNFRDNDVHMICLNEDDSVIGWCFLNQTRQAPAYEIAMTIDCDHWRDGFGTEVFQALFDVANNAECIDQLWEQVHVENLASLKIMNRFGFHEIEDGRPDFRSFNLDVS